MKSVRVPLLLAASPPLCASVAVLYFAGVGRHVWLIHVLLVCAASLLAAAGRLLDRRVRGRMPARAAILITLACLAVPFVSGAPGPYRWIPVGPLNLYIAPLLLPSFLAACSMLVLSKGVAKTLTFPALSVAGVLLALQPDASQALALLAGASILVLCCEARSAVSTAALIALALAAGCAFMRPDPLQPVPHVEEVFALSFEHSFLAGLVVGTSALVFIVSLCVFSLRGPAWLAAVAGYYAVLFCCSVAGLTPAPLIGFGAGPLLGFGLLTFVAPWMSPADLCARCTW